MPRAAPVTRATFCAVCVMSCPSSVIPGRGLFRPRTRNPYAAARGLWIPGSRASLAPRNDKSKSILVFLEGVAERVRGIDAQDAQLLGEEGELLKRKHQCAVVG